MTGSISVFSLRTHVMRQIEVPLKMIRHFKTWSFFDGRQTKPPQPMPRMRKARSIVFIKCNLPIYYKEWLLKI